MFNDPTFVKNFAEMVKKLNIKTALEVGCLSGELRDALRGIGIKCDGIELNPKRSDVIKGDFMVWTKKYDLIFSSGVLEHFDRKDALKMLRRMKRFGTYVLNFVPNSECEGYMQARSRTKAEWKDEIPFTLEELIKMHETAKLEVADCGGAGREWSKRFGGDGSQPYLVWCLGK